MKRWRMIALIMAVLMLALPFSAAAEDGEAVSGPQEEEASLEPPEELPDDFLVEFGGSEGGSEEIGTFLTEDTFQVGDVPEDYLEPSKNPGRVERIRYKVPGEEGTEADEKVVLVYLPVGYDDSDEPYNVLYHLHALGGSGKTYLDLNEATPFQCLLDHMIENGELDPLIVVAPTYYSSSATFDKYMPLAMQVEAQSDFPDELTDYIIPAVEGQYRTYAETTDREGIEASRDHRAIDGFSLGGTVTWYTFIQKMFAFRWFLPISEASWDDGEGGIQGIWDSDLSAQVLYDAVGEQGFTKDDFYLFVATGTDDEAFEVATEQMKSLLAYDDLFITGGNTSCSMMLGGTHTVSAVYTYIYHILPVIFFNV